MSNNFTISSMRSSESTYSPSTGGPAAASANATAAFIDGERKFPAMTPTTTYVDVPALKEKLVRKLRWRTIFDACISEKETSPLHIAVYVGSLEQVQNLLTNGADKRATCTTGTNAERLARRRFNALEANLYTENNFTDRKPCPLRIQELQNEMAEVNKIIDLVEIK